MMGVLVVLSFFIVILLAFLFSTWDEKGRAQASMAWWMKRWEDSEYERMTVKRENKQLKLSNKELEWRLSHRHSGSSPSA